MAKRPIKKLVNKVQANRKAKTTAKMEAKGAAAIAAKKKKTPVKNSSPSTREKNIAIARDNYKKATDKPLSSTRTRVGYKRKAKKISAAEEALAKSKKLKTSTSKTKNKAGGRAKSIPGIIGKRAKSSKLEKDAGQYTKTNKAQRTPVEAKPKTVGGGTFKRNPGKAKVKFQSRGEGSRALKGRSKSKVKLQGSTKRKRK